MLLNINPYYTSTNDPIRFEEMMNRLKLGRNSTITTASSQSESVMEAPVPVTIITREMIEMLSNNKSIGNILATYVPGLTEVCSYAFSNISMHGVYTNGQEKILIMENGHRLNARSTNNGKLDYAISTEKIDHIEVLRGPASSLYGNVALTAVVNIITKKGSEHYVNYLTSDSAKAVLRKRIEAYLENKCLHFADKEQFPDLEIENDSKEEGTAPAIAKRYDDTYQIAYIDGQGKRQNKTIKNANFSSFIAGIKYRENWEELVSKLSDGMKVHLKKDPNNEFDPSAIAVYNGDDCLGYIPQKDIPAVSWCMNGDELDAEIEYIDEDYVSLVIPATFQNLSNCDDEELEGVRFSKTERTKYEIGAYQEARISISKEEFLEGIKQQIETL
jgi:hypothetical protein